jgi:hypothetical protein
MPINPRRSPRVECAMPVYWSRWRNQLSGEVRRCNVHGMFITTPHDADVGFLMDLTIVMPWGAISCTAVPRFVGLTPEGRGLGVELHVMDRGDRALWSAHYRRALAEHNQR